MAKKNEIIIEVQVNAGESAEKLAEVRQRIQKLKAETKTYKADIADLNRTMQQNGKLTEEETQQLNRLTRQVSTNEATLKELTAQEKVYNAQIQLDTQNNRKFGDSITELGAQLAQLKQEYRALTAEQRESAKGKEMLKSIQELDNQVKELDYSLGDHQRNVGNYASALLGLNGNVVKVANLFAGGFKNGITAAGTALKGLGKTILATPVGWISAAIAAAVKVFNELRDAFKRNDDAGTALSVAMARLQPIVTAVKEAFSALATVVAKVVGGITSAATAVLNLIPAYRKASEAAQELVMTQDALQDKQREYVVNEAERDKEIAELRKKAVSDEKLTAKEREEIYKQIDDLSRKNMEERKNIAAENYRILQEEAKKNNDTSDAMKDKLAQAYAEMIKAQTDYLNETTRIGSRQRQAREEQAKAEAEEEKQKLEERKRRWQEYQQQRVEAARVAQEELRKLEDLQTQMIEDEPERRREEIKKSYTRQINDINKRLDTEKNLTVDARKSLVEQVNILNEMMWRELAAVDDEEIQATVERIKKMEDETARAAADAAKAAANATAAERQKIVDDYNKKAQQQVNAQKERLNAVFGNAVEEARIELEAAESYYEQLIEMDAATKEALYGNEDAYKSAVLDAEAQMMQARQSNMEMLQQQAKTTADTAKAMTAAMSGLFEAAAGDSEAYAVYKKAIAIVEATISLAESIAAATSASTAGDPYTMAIRIATNVAAVAAQFASVISAIKSATIPSAPSFAEGGIVPGSSWTGDKVDIKANSGEMIINRTDQQRLFELITSGYTLSGIDYARLALVMRNAISELPAPVLDYSEFVAYGNKVAMEQKRLAEY